MKNKTKVKKVKIKTLTKERNQGLILTNPRSVQKFLAKSPVTIAEAITGALSVGTSGLVTAGARLIQGAIKGNLYTQFGREMSKLIEEGKIKEDYPSSKYGFKSLEELLAFIDNETPDEDRFNAVKGMFYSLNSTDVKDAGEEILRYRLFQIALSLTSTQIIILKLSYSFSKSNHQLDTSARGWISRMSKEMGHGIDNLVSLDEKVLMEKELIYPRIHPDNSGIIITDARLTKLGLSLCENLSKY